MTTPTEPTKEAMKRANDVLRTTGRNPFGISSTEELVLAFALAFTADAARIKELEEGMKAVLASAFPNQREQPAMFAAWKSAAELLAKGK